MKIRSEQIVNEVLELYRVKFKELLGGLLVAMVAALPVVTFAPAILSYYRYLMGLIEGRNLKPLDMVGLLKENFIGGWKFFLVYFLIMGVLTSLLVVPGLLFLIFTIYSPVLFLGGRGVLSSFRASFRAFIDHYEASVVVVMVFVVTILGERLASYTLDLVYPGLGMVVKPLVAPLPLLFSTWVGVKAGEGYSN